MRRTMRDHESFNVEHQHRIEWSKSKDSMQNFNASKMTTRGRASMKSLNEKLKLSQTFLIINSQQSWMQEACTKYKVKNLTFKMMVIESWMWEGSSKSYVVISKTHIHKPTPPPKGTLIIQDGAKWSKTFILISWY